MSRNDTQSYKSIDEMLEHGNNLLSENKWNEAQALFEKALQDRPDDPDIRVSLGLVAFQQGHQEIAERYFQEALSVNPDLTAAYFNLGLLFEERGEAGSALSFYKEVLRRQPQDIESLIRMGHCAQTLDRTDDALSFWEEVLRLAPQHPDAGNLVAVIYIERGMWQKAEDALRVSLVSHPQEVSLHFVLGVVLKEQEKWESALAAFNKVVTLDQEHADGFFHLGEVCLALDLVKQAEPFFANAYKLDPSNLEALHLLGFVYEKRKDKKSAVMMYEQWVERVEAELDDMEISVFNRICAYVAKYWLKQGDGTKASLFDGKIHQEPEDDFRVSLTIDD
ncbi:tetratricopeptide repeat protein [bacterium]|nr:tetratricopeptide repeat protein [bacterium]